MKLNRKVKVTTNLLKQTDIQFILVKREKEKENLKFKIFSTDTEDAKIFHETVAKLDPFAATERKQIHFYNIKPETSQIAFHLISKDFFKPETKNSEKKEYLLDFVANQSRFLFKDKSVSINLTDIDSFSRESGLSVEEISEQFVEGLLLGGYKFDIYQTQDKEKKTKKQEKKKGLSSDKKITLQVNKSRVSDFEKIIREKEILIESVSAARDLVNEPPNVLTAGAYVEWVKKQVPKKLKIKQSILNKKDFEAMGMGGILAVNQGSKEEPYLIELDYTPTNFDPKRDKTVVLVGKGVTFDSGGLSLKPSKAMEDMKMDMGGSAASICAFLAIAKLGLKVRVVSITPITDNMTGGDAFKVGDIIKTYSGKTVEVLNTDAEGRLILADALTYGVEKYPTDYVIDLATLTGACLVALGVYYTGLFSEGKEVSRRLLESSDCTGERLWSLPMGDVFSKELKSSVADLKNIGSSYGGASTAAKFLEEFIVPRAENSVASKLFKNANTLNMVRDYNFKDGKAKFEWAHLDIAPTMLANNTQGHQTKGATGVGVRLLVDFVKNLQKSKKK